MDAFQREVGEWADRTFPESNSISISKHLGDEVAELRTVLEAAVVLGYAGHDINDAAKGYR